LNQAAVWTPYCGAAPVPSELLARWNFDPPLLATIALAAWLGLRYADGAPGQRRLWIAATLLTMLLFASPFCALTSALFSARAVHHLALTALLAPLLAAALPTARAAGGLALWFALHAATFWLWHLPQSYELALSNDAVYWLMQASLLFTALALWRGVRSAPLPSAIAALLATMIQMGLLGALLTFIGTPLYEPHRLAPLAWGLSPLEDQQIAGLIMWAPGAALYLAAALALTARWFALERRQTLAS
jgi:putative membrane protein